MLSRSAQGLYWMTRYLERAGHLCRLLQLQVETLVDRPLREIHFGWDRVYKSMNQSPFSGGAIEKFDSDDYTLADSYTLADHLTFERFNPDSIWNCVAYARENARQVRNHIAAEMWFSLNTTYLRLQKLDIQKIWKIAPESFYAETIEEISAFAGVAEATMYRDEGWRFMQLGRFMERAQLSAAILLAQIDADRRQDGSFDADWANLLHVYHAFDAYVHTYSVVVQPDQVLDLLVTDPSLPRSLYQSLESIASELNAIGPGPGSGSSAGSGCSGQPPLPSDPAQLAGKGRSGGHSRPGERKLPASPRSHLRSLYQLSHRGISRTLTGMVETIQYDIDHVSWYYYSFPTRRCSMSLCLKPGEAPSQRLISFKIETDPSASLHQEVDCFGNFKYNLNIYREHSSLKITARSKVRKEPLPPLPDGIGAEAWEEIRGWNTSFHHWDFLLPSPLSKPSPALDAFVEQHGIKPDNDPLVSLLRLSDTLYHSFEYVPGSTSTASPIEHILESGRGVCQDYARVMIAIARSWGIPTRYVMGYFYDAALAGGESKEHSTHAWVECLLPRLAWVGFDPTNQSFADERHIRVAVGRDYQDVSPTRGVLYGGGETRLDIDVRMRT